MLTGSEKEKSISEDKGRKRKWKIQLLSNVEEVGRLSIPDWICTCKNSISYNNQSNRSALLQFNLRGNSRD